ncbi:T. brucei spp.-specific protein [Trypanosoma brucei gambiense DAL972]|uniref:T. brucei spp.-specific protein n=1 Tax=Trypanosoma brucei gambiense (strain MHOM/CI/86/DAL972) TaxID=679716 RepID=C9ZVB5_TRYB9|nr:T. brucei spp.-specific protein [Trypanosoma brucei gambiense DAL972]CBH13353.1 T. brucei spp.-specific protein [Trypanosoma brucei gambiense DAL972]|eukprot:XP_011775630.1 T. brucei spp.-specific protein [Trypanosoma brucei gambiense DAL972]
MFTHDNTIQLDVAYVFCYQEKEKGKKGIQTVGSMNQKVGQFNHSHLPPVFTPLNFTRGGAAAAVACAHRYCIVVHSWVFSFALMFFFFTSSPFHLNAGASAVGG